MDDGIVELIGSWGQVGHISVEIPTHLNERSAELQPQVSAYLNKEQANFSWDNK